MNTDSGPVNEGQQRGDVDDQHRHVREVIASISRIDVSELADDVNVREELGIDSLMAMEIIATIEKALQIHIDEAQYADIETVGEFIDLVIAACRDTNG
jgi:acyl carrier protein